jgi:sulfite exporter TauE/SafE
LEPWKRDRVTLFMLSFMAGLSGGGHCLGMCGGIVAALAVAAPQENSRSRLICNLSYHTGRIGTYTLLGLVAGAASQMAQFSSLKTHLVWLFVAANIMVIILGLATAFGLRQLSLSALDGAGFGFMGRMLRRASQRTSPAAFLGTGLVMGLLPCGLVYGVLITAATSGSWLTGAGMLFAFGLGTMPALLAYGQVASALSTVTGTLFLRILGLAVALLGIVGLLKSLLRMGLIAPAQLW